MPAKRKPKTIPESVIRELQKDLASFEPAPEPFSLVETSFPVIPAAAKVRIQREATPAFGRPVRGARKIANLDAESEHRIVGALNGYIGIEHDNSASWIKKGDIDTVQMNYHPDILKVAAVPMVDTSLKSNALGGWLDRKRDELIERAVALRNKYAANDYIALKGFSIEIGLSPSLSFEFEFKT